MSDLLMEFDKELADLEESESAMLSEEGEELLTGEPARRACLRPEVAELMLAGVAHSEIAKRIGVKPGALRYWKRTQQMSDLLELEGRRIMRHLSTRDLGKEKYLGLATAVGVMIDKSQLLRDRPTEIRREVGAGAIERLRVAIEIGRSRVAGSVSIETRGDGDGQRELGQVLEREDEFGEVGGSPADLGGNLVRMRD